MSHSKENECLASSVIGGVDAILFNLSVIVTLNKCVIVNLLYQDDVNSEHAEKGLRQNFMHWLPEESRSSEARATKEE